MAQFINGKRMELMVIIKILTYHNLIFRINKENDE